MHDTYKTQKTHKKTETGIVHSHMFILEGQFVKCGQNLRFIKLKIVAECEETTVYVIKGVFVLCCRDLY